MDFSKETYDATYTKVADGVWVIGSPHRPHHKDSMPELNNRGFIFSVSDDKHGNHLLMSGLPASDLVANVQQIEKEEGLKLQVVVTSGDFHHMSMVGWLDAYPEATFIHSGLKFPSTRNGKNILANESYKSRIILEKGFEFPSLQQYSDTIQFFGFNQFFVYPDTDGMPISEKETTKRNENLMKYMSKIPACTEPCLSIWLYHVPTKQLLLEHDFQICMSKEQLAKAHFMIRMMMKPGMFYSAAFEKMPNGPRTLETCKIHCEQRAKILELDVRAISDYHTYPGEKAQIRTYDSKEEFVKDFTAALAKTGEDDPTGKKMFKKVKGSGCVIS